MAYNRFLGKIISKIMKKITFLLPKPSLTPAGGYKVVFEYSNMLVKDGYLVSIVYPSLLRGKITLKSLYNSIKNYIKFYLLKYRLRDSWFSIDAQVVQKMLFRISERYLPKSDVYIATSVETAMDLNEIKTDAHMMYLIQHFESWITSDENVIQTYSNGMTNIVISRWLFNIVSQYSSNCTLIPNGFNFSIFNTYMLPINRNKFNLMMLYHNIDWKGCNDSFAALEIVKSIYPECHVTIFGVPNRPDFLPDWYHYVQTPTPETLNSLYNNASIFLGASWYEGWGLTIGEAMACSCAVVCTDNDGYKEMAIDGKTALLSPIKQPKMLAENILKLIENDDLRLLIAENGRRYIQDFTWQKSYSKLKTLIEIGA